MTATADLISDLQQQIGTEQVKFDRLTRHLYSTDASNYQIMPVGVTFPRNADDVVAIHEAANRYDIPVLPRGGGSSLAGQAVGEAIVMDFTRHMRRVTSINAEAKSVTVEPGLTLGLLNRQLGSLGLMFGPDPASAQRAAVGGVVGNNSTGAHSIIYGMTADHVKRLKVVLASGECVWLDANTQLLNSMRTSVSKIVQDNSAEIALRYPKTFRTVAGYALDKINPADVDLNWLLTGSEGTLGTLVEIELGLVEVVPAGKRRLALVHFDSMIASLEATPRILETEPSAIELLDKMLLDRTRANAEFIQYLTFVDGDPAAILIVEYYGKNETELSLKLDNLNTMLKRIGHRGAVTYATSPERQQDVWKIRKAGLGLLMSERSEAKPSAFIEDAAVPVERLADYIRDVDDIIRCEDADYAIYAHASAGCLHVRPLINLKTLKGRQQYRNIAQAAADAIVKYSGTITGEHGQGLARSEFVERLFGTQLNDAFRDIKRLFDPNNLMNPGKIVDSPPMDDESILRYTPDYELIQVETRFDWSADNGYAGAVEMCNGSGVCRKEETGTMCPSYMATLDEGHVTRGRANALRQALSGQLPGGMGSHEVKGLMDLCLSCKACKSECPSAVDLAKIKAEFMASYHDEHGTPIRSRVFGNIHRINKLAGLTPSLSNMMLRSPIGQAAFKLLGIPTERPLPLYASERFSSRPATNHNGSAAATLVIDTFTEFNHPQLGEAFMQLVDKLGVNVNVMRLPGQGCCGRPAMSRGLLDLAKSMAEDNIEHLAGDDTRPLLFLEPSCQSAFVDDYLALVHSSLQQKAKQVASRCMSAERWIAEQLAQTDVTWVQDSPSRILLHGHCHQKTLWGTKDTVAMLRSIPDVSVEEIDSGCCGVAGSFGYEHYDISMKIGEQRLLPTIRANADAMVAAPGTSCRAQIDDAGLQAQHPIEILAQALR